MSAIAHGWHPSGLDIPVKVAREFHAADAGHKYGKGMDKKTKALRAIKHYRKARGGSIEGDGKDDVSYGGTLPRSLQPMTTHIPDSWLRSPRYADGGDIPDVGEPLIPSGGQFSPGTHLGNKASDIGSKLAYSYMKAPVEAAMYPGMAYQSKEPITTEQMVGPASNIAMQGLGSAGVRPQAGVSGVFVGPYGAQMLRDADRAAGRPTIPHPVVAAEIATRAASLRPEFRDIYKGQVQDMRDAEARAAIESRQGSVNPPISDRDIWARSGWTRGFEGMAKKEIPDTGAKLVRSEVPDEHGNPMYELIHPAGNLHKIYDIPPIKFDQKIKEGNGSFNDENNQIIIGGKPTKENLKDAIGTALHEFQHAIQKKEGFAYGSNLQQAIRRPEFGQEIFPSENKGGEGRNSATIITYGPRPFQKAPIPSWQEKLADIQRASGGDPTSEANAFNRAAFSTYQRTAGETEARNVSKRWKENSYLQHPEDTEDITRGLQYIEGKMMARNKAEMKAGGGKVGNFDPERGAAIGLSRQGMIRSAVPGRTDKLNLNVPSGSYIIPADIPSALGQGNSTAGGAILDKMFNKGPYGMGLPRARAGSRVGKRKTSLSGFAKGGEVGHPTPIMAAGGEYTIHPDTVADLGNGDIELGHSILDSFVKQVRAKHISTLKGLKPPKGSK